MKNILLENNFLYRISAYDFLRRVYLCELSLDFFNKMIIHADKDDDNLIFEYAKRAKSLEYEKLYHEMKIEYTRLFVGPKKLPAPPYSSVYLNNNGLIMQEETMEVRKMYLESGVQKINMNQEPDDHIGTQMEFMYFLNSKAFFALQSKNYDEFHEFYQKQKAFCLEYMTNWIPLFCNDVSKKTNNAFWKMIARFTKQILLEDVKNFETFKQIEWENRL